MIYSKKTGDILVTVTPEYQEGRSSVVDGVFVWSYFIHIENEGDEPVQLINRHWRIIDENGRTENVDGAGVVGLQPLISPGTDFEYASGVSLATPSGMMMGSYEMIKNSTNIITVEIPAFSLDCPAVKGRVN